MAKKILMIGSAREVRGGISAVVNVYFANGLFDRHDARYVETHCDGGKLRKLAKAARAGFIVMAMLVARRVALLHVHIASDASFWRKSLFIVPAHALGVPYILHMHGGRFLEFYRANGPAVRRFIRRIYREAQVVIALSDEWRDTLHSISPESRFVVIPNPVEIPRWQAALDSPPPTVLYLGLIKEAKGAHDLLRAWPAVIAAVPEARVILAGSGDVEGARSLAGDLGIERSVELPGWIVGEAREKWLRDAWVFALPSHGEAMPMSILESMAAGIPTVATRVGGVPAAVEEGRTGILLEPRDTAALASALIALLCDERRRKAMGAFARERARRNFSTDAILPQIEALWTRSGGGGARRRRPTRESEPR
jgi:glycosyltransferase involved in cell wall biosynthesis